MSCSLSLYSCLFQDTRIIHSCLMWCENYTCFDKVGEAPACRWFCEVRGSHPGFRLTNMIIRKLHNEQPSTSKTYLSVIVGKYDTLGCRCGCGYDGGSVVRCPIHSRNASVRCSVSGNRVLGLLARTLSLKPRLSFSHPPHLTTFSVLNPYTRCLSPVAIALLCGKQVMMGIY